MEVDQPVDESNVPGSQNHVIVFNDQEQVIAGDPPGVNDQSELRQDVVQSEAIVDKNVVQVPILISSQDSSSKNKYDEEDDDGTLCPICLDNWTNSGDHRICSLKCGHVYCYKCVVRWLETQKSCPTCKKRAIKKDIRYIYAKRLIAVDNSELESLRNQLSVVIEEKNNMQLDLSRYICREGILRQTIEQLESRVQEFSNKELQYKRSRVLNETPDLKIYMEKSLEICRQNGCRVFDCCSSNDLIMVSSKSPNNLFAGFGIRKVTLSQYRPLAFIPLHQQQIRDVCFHPVNNWLLTASMDKSFKVTDTINNKINLTSSQPMPLWSCCWDADNPNIFYIGTQGGTLVKYDVRSLEEPVFTFSIPGDMSPVVSVASMSAAPGSEFPHGGIVCCKLSSLWFFETRGNEYLKHSLPLSGPFVSMKYDNQTKHLLVSSRPNNMIAHSRHVLCTLSKNSSGGVDCDTIHTFSGGGMQKLLSKSCFVSDRQQYVAAYEESNKCVFLWSINTGDRIFSVPANDAVLDLRGVQNGSDNLLVSLTERKMNFFKLS